MNNQLTHFDFNLYELRVRCDRAEVMLRNLLQLQGADKVCFTVPHDDVVVTIETAIGLLVE